jgi:transposase-like protein
MQNESWQRALAEQRAWTRDEARQAVNAAEASGMKMAEFARAHGGTAGRFEYWRKRLLQQGTAVGNGRLLPVRVVEPGQARLVERPAGRVVLIDDRIRVEMEGMTAEWVATLIRLLRQSER